MHQSRSPVTARRLGTALLAALTVTGCASGSDIAQNADGAPPSAPPAATATPAPGFRLVGFGDIAIEVPEAWRTNHLRCGTPVKDTVAIDVGGVRSCLIPRPKGVESVSVFQGRPGYPFAAATDVTIDGRTAARERTRCAREEGTRVCRGTVYFPAENLVFGAASSTAAEKVDEILGRIRVLPGRVGVPGHREDFGTDAELADGAYATALRAAGLVPEVVEERRPGLPAGYVLAAEPPPGTMLRPGDTVRVTVVPAPRGLADEVVVSLAITDAEGNDLLRRSDEELRAGTTVRMPVGGELRVYGKGPEVVYGGDLDGPSLVADPRPDRVGVAYWRGERAGTTRLTVTVGEGAARDTVGVITVVVTD